MRGIETATKEIYSTSVLTGLDIGLIPVKLLNFVVGTDLKRRFSFPVRYFNKERSESLKTATNENQKTLKFKLAVFAGSVLKRPEFTLYFHVLKSGFIKLFLSWVEQQKNVAGASETATWQIQSYFI